MGIIKERLNIIFADITMPRIIFGGISLIGLFWSVLYNAGGKDYRDFSFQNYLPEIVYLVGIIGCILTNYFTK